MIWLAYSVDPNSIESVWNRMKDFIEHKYTDLPDGEEGSCDELLKFVSEA